MPTADATKTRAVRVRLSCERENATEVFVAGTFNGWNPRATPMKRGSGDEWSAGLELTPGGYEYKFVIDGEWRCGEGCDSRHADCAKYVPNPFGTMNHKLQVS